MNLPKKLKKANSSTSSFFVRDENDRNIFFPSLWLTIEHQEIVSDEIIKRYNSYNKLVIALVVVSTLLVFASFTIVQLIRFKLI